MAMVRVLLKRNFRTPAGRFSRSIDGVPTPIPEKVIKLYGLPRDAVRVDDNYIPPALRDDDTDLSLEVSAAEQERRIREEVDARTKEIERRLREEMNQKVAARAAAAADKIEGDGEEDSLGDGEDGDTDPGDDILDGTVNEISSRLEEKTKEELLELLDREQKGKTRKGVVVAIRAALEDLEDD